MTARFEEQGDKEKVTLMLDEGCTDLKAGKAYIINIKPLRACMCMDEEILFSRVAIASLGWIYWCMSPSFSPLTLHMTCMSRSINILICFSTLLSC